MYHAEYTPPTMDPENHKVFKESSFATPIWKAQCDFFLGMLRGLGWNKSLKCPNTGKGGEKNNKSQQLSGKKNGPAVQQYQLLLVQEAPKTAAEAGSFVRPVA